MRTTVPSTTSPCLKLRMSASCSASSSAIVDGSGPTGRAGSAPAPRRSRRRGHRPRRRPHAPPRRTRRRRPRRPAPPRRSSSATTSRRTTRPRAPRTHPRLDRFRDELLGDDLGGERLGGELLGGILRLDGFGDELLGDDLGRERSRRRAPRRHRHHRRSPQHGLRARAHPMRPRPPPPRRRAPRRRRRRRQPPRRAPRDGLDDQRLLGQHLRDRRRAHGAAPRRALSDGDLAASTASTASSSATASATIASSANSTAASIAAISSTTATARSAVVAASGASAGASCAAGSGVVVCCCSSVKGPCSWSGFRPRNENDGRASLEPSSGSRFAVRAPCVRSVPPGASVGLGSSAVAPLGPRESSTGVMADTIRRVPELPDLAILADAFAAALARPAGDGRAHRRSPRPAGDAEPGGDARRPGPAGRREARQASRLPARSARHLGRADADRAFRPGRARRRRAAGRARHRVRSGAGGARARRRPGSPGQRGCRTRGAEVELRYLDPTRMGKIYLAPAGDPSGVPGIAELGPDADDPALTLDEWQARIRRHPGELKALLRNQAFVAGIGNAYSDEILWEARLSPFRRRATLAPEETAALLRRHPVGPRGGHRASCAPACRRRSRSRCATTCASTCAAASRAPAAGRRSARWGVARRRPTAAPASADGPPPDARVREAGAPARPGSATGS